MTQCQLSGLVRIAAAPILPDLTEGICCHQPLKGSIMLHDAWGQKLTHGRECCLTDAVACVAAGQGRPSWSKWLTTVLFTALCSGTAFMLAPSTSLAPPVASWQLAVSGAHLSCNHTRPLLQAVYQHHLCLLLQCETCGIMLHAQCSLSSPKAYAFKRSACQRCNDACVAILVCIILFLLLCTDAAMLCDAPFRLLASCCFGF